MWSHVMCLPPHWASGSFENRTMKRRAWKFTPQPRVCNQKKYKELLTFCIAVSVLQSELHCTLCRAILSTDCLRPESNSKAWHVIKILTPILPNCTSECLRHWRLWRRGAGKWQRFSRFPSTRKSENERERVEQRNGKSKQNGDHSQLLLNHTLHYKNQWIQLTLSDTGGKWKLYNILFKRKYNLYCLLT